MKHLTEAVRQSVKDENWYSALALALTLPDIASKLEHPDVKTTTRYCNWAQEHITPKYSGLPTAGGQNEPLSGKDVYALRCAVLHEGSFDTNVHMKNEAKRAFTMFQFTSPLPNDNTVHRNNFYGKLQLEVDKFAIDVADAVDAWSDALQAVAPLLRMRDLMRIETFLQTDGNIRI